MKRVIGLISLSACACTVHHLEKNAPGVDDVRVLPSRLSSREVHQPSDPGENMVSLTYGVLAAGGAAFPKKGDPVGSYGVGPEVSVHVGSSESSHPDDSPPVLPSRAIGLNVGWTALAHPGTGLGPLYGELQYTEQPYYLAGGWAWDADDRHHGPQATLGFGPLFIRYTQLLNETGMLHFGLVMKGYDTWVWSK